MYKIEKFLIDHKFKKVREYNSGVIVYDDRDQEREYNTEVAIFTKHDPLIYEIVIISPYSVNLQNNKNYDEEYWKDQIETHKCLAEDHVDYAKGMHEWLKEEVQDPWEVIE